MYFQVKPPVVFPVLADFDIADGAMSYLFAAAMAEGKISPVSTHMQVFRMFFLLLVSLKVLFFAYFAFLPEHGKQVFLFSFSLHKKNSLPHSSHILAGCALTNSALIRSYFSQVKQGFKLAFFVCMAFSLYISQVLNSSIVQVLGSFKLSFLDPKIDTFISFFIFIIPLI